MYIDESVLGECLDKERLEALGKQKREIKERFEKVQKIFEEIDKIDSIQNTEKLIGDVNIRSIFAPSRIDLTADERYLGIENQARYFQSEKWANLISWKKKIEDNNDIEHMEMKELIVSVLSIIGGFDDKKMKDEYRILSNPYKDKNDFDKSLRSNGQCAWINSHFADNTLFFEFIDFVQKCQEDKPIVLDWYQNIALCYPHTKEGSEFVGKLSGCKDSDKSRVEEQEKSYQREILAYRFPLKFLWMWANRDRVIHPLSLMAFREFLKSDFMYGIFQELKKVEFAKNPYEKNDVSIDNNPSEYAKRITNAKIEYFQNLWSEVSNAIMNKLYGENWKEEERKKKLEEVSLLISLLTLGETDMANIDELLKTHKQIILYGVPGTGKTHSAKDLITKWSGKDIQDFSELKKWQFSEIVKEKHDLNSKKQDCKICHDINNSPIIWEIMQFHPNTTYQDFIGGITPKIDKETLLYELKDGKFKKFCEYANKYGTKGGVGEKPFVFIIDEINRANLSEVLGELLYALEYRDEGITIPNFDNKPFVIPNNVYIIGTMNNVDKSLSTFDLALRRRFGFYEIKPDLGALNKILSFEEKTSDQKQQGSEAEKPLISEIENYIARCENLNKKIIEKLGDKNAQIGQAYYGKIKHFLNQNEEKQVVTPFHLQKLWDYHLEPLLQEYVGFMDDGEKKVEDLKKVWLGKVEE